MFYFLFWVLAHCNNFPQEADPSLLFLLNVAFLTMKHKYQFQSLWFDPSEARTHDHVNHYISDVVCYMLYENNKLSKMVVFKFRALS